MSSPRFTVFTPSHDRAHTIARVRDSLEAQTTRDFEWLVVDDGSTDGTYDLVSGWAAGSSFPIRVFQQAHANKHVAMNLAVAEARGELLLTLDSDDTCVPWALERLGAIWDGIPATERAGFAGVTGLCVDETGEVVGDVFPRDPLDSNPLELRYHYHVGGEKWGFTRTDLMRAHPRPEPDAPPNRAKPPEGVVWDAIGRTHRTRYVNEALRTYFRDQGVALSRPKGVRRGDVGALVGYRTLLDEDLRWFRDAPAAFLLDAGRYIRFSLLAGEGPIRQVRTLHDPRARLLWLVSWPVGVAMLGRDLIREAARRLPWPR